MVFYRPLHSYHWSAKKLREEQKYARLVEAINATHAKGWRYVEGWLFVSPRGIIHDLSGMDLAKLDEIDAKWQPQ